MPKFNVNSWHSRWYRFSYSDKLPSNLCPYFWKIVLSLVLLPMLPISVFSKWLILKIFPDSDFRESGWTSILFPIILFAIIGILLFPISMVAIFFTHKPPFLVFGIAGWTIAVIVLFYWLRANWIASRPYKEKQEGLFSSFIKAKKDKICPRIEWDK